MKKEIFCLLIGVLCCFSALAQNTGVKKDTTKAKPDIKVKPKAYNEVITAKAITQHGLFTVHQVEDNYYFEIADSLLDRDILVVNRIKRSASGDRPQEGFLGYAGDEIGEYVVRFTKGPANKIFLRTITYRGADRSKDSTANGMYRSWRNSNLQPVREAFNIKAYTPDSSGVVIDMTDFISGAGNILFFHDGYKKVYGLGAFQADKSYIDHIRSFPSDIEIKTFKTYQGESNNDEFLSFELNSSLIPLPREPMKSRLADPRVGYFGIGFRDLDANPYRLDGEYYITKWRLEPKPEDIGRYKKGELVEPRKPIVFYIDPATPKKWVPYLIQGVNDWQKAFEKAGFKNAIYALEAPINDPNWDLQDATHNTIVYKASFNENAYGPSVVDPRTGEILNAQVQWFHNVLQLLHDWYFVQAGAVDSLAREVEYPDTLMGKLIRFVSSHEVGHTLGLAHNFAASTAVAVDSLRNKRWVEENGICPSIMDYARFNYVAQPEDHISEKGMMPKIGAYDKWAIEWGYKWLPQFQTEKEESAYMTKWIIERIGKDKRLWYGFEGLMDPRMQSEDLGDDPVKASEYGLKNLKRILPHVIDWTLEPGKGYNAARLMYGRIIQQYKRYLSHVAFNIGSFTTTDKTMEEKGAVYAFNNREKQRTAVQFLQRELFTTPSWFMNKSFYAMFNEGYYLQIYNIQDPVLQYLLSSRILGSLYKFESIYPEKAYTCTKYLNDLQSGIWSELASHKPIDMYRRNLQKSYVIQFAKVLSAPNAAPVEGAAASARADYTYYQKTDILALLKVQAKDLLGEINKSLPQYHDKLTKLHLQEAKEILSDALYPKNINLPGSTSEGPAGKQAIAPGTFTSDPFGAGVPFKY